MKETFIVHSNDLDKLATKTLSLLEEVDSPSAKVLLLLGDLGAGKTTFTKELAALLGVEKEDVHSPTFILKKEYSTYHSRFRKLIHIDAYRFNDPDEAKVLKLEKDIEDYRNIIVIEWPSKMMIPLTTMTASFEIVDDETREVTLTKDRFS